MRFPRIRLTIIHMTGVIAAFGVGLGPLNHPSKIWLGVLLYLKFAVLIGATFLARYSRNRDWWFGFAAVGWASVVFYLPSNWDLLWYMDRPTGINYFDLTGHAGNFLADLKPNRTVGTGRFDRSIAYTVIAQFWVTMASSFIGGYLALIMASIKKPEAT